MRFRRITSRAWENEAFAFAAMIFYERFAFASSPPPRAPMLRGCPGRGFLRTASVRCYRGLCEPARMRQGETTTLGLRGGECFDKRFACRSVAAKARQAPVPPGTDQLSCCL